MTICRAQITVKSMYNPKPHHLLVFMYIVHTYDMYDIHIYIYKDIYIICSLVNQCKILNHTICSFPPWFGVKIKDMWNHHHDQHFFNTAKGAEVVQRLRKTRIALNGQVIVFQRLDGRIFLCEKNDGQSWWNDGSHLGYVVSCWGLYIYIYICISHFLSGSNDGLDGKMMAYMAREKNTPAPNCWRFWSP